VYGLPEDGKVTTKQAGINEDLYSYVFRCAYMGFIKENCSTDEIFKTPSWNYETR